MKTLAKLTAAGAALVLSGGLAFAECIDTETTASTESTSETVKTPPIEKDGSMAPLEAEPRDSAEGPDAGQAGEERDFVQKDGSTMPLASGEDDDTNENLATSQQDVEAQQEGEQTAAAEADDAC